MHSVGPDPLRQLAAECGVDTEYHDWRGVHRVVAADTLRAVLAAFDVDAGSDDACLAALEQRRAARRDAVLPPCLVLRSGKPHSIDLEAGADIDVMPTARVRLEGGGDVELAVTPSAARAREHTLAQAHVPAGLPTGYHRLEVDLGAGGRHACELIVTPARLALPSRLAGSHWGLAIQLYSTRSTRSWEVGDLADLGALASWSASAHGADFVLVNPLHAAEVTAPMNPSPYLPTSRRFGNPLYLRVEDVAEYAGLDDAQRAKVDDLGQRAKAARADDHLDRDAAWLAKLAALETIYGAGRDDSRAAALSRYCELQGESLDRFAMWCALSERHGADWHEWPAQLREPTSPAVAEFSAAHADRVEFYRWLQWQMDEQLDGAQHAAVDAGMRIGVIHDVAVGVSADGADAWSHQDVLASGVRVGAPPDAYSQLGQDWRQPPWRPDRLSELAYAPLRELFRAMLRHAGGLRVDHIIGLFRLWWIPAGKEAVEGTYVRYDAEALIGVLALEAERADAVIIGEDLGNVESWVRDHLRDRGVLGTNILWFEVDHGDGSPLPSDRWRRDCLASVTTHDLPPTTGYLAGDHIRLRERLGLLTRPVAEELDVAEKERDAWRQLLAREGLLDAGASPSADELVVALHAFVARTPALLHCVSLTDAVGERRTQNQPGTLDEYPNWRIPLGRPDGRSILLEDVESDDRVARVIAAIRPSRSA